MPAKPLISTDSKFIVLLRDYGYSFKDGTLIDNGIKGYISPSIVGKFSSAMVACEYLCPIIGEKEYTNRLVNLEKES